ncbi:SdrD B-like domain-containing protein [Caulifigura coniformis]|nr:SdrD B-like domain-containing protein [Caulifigura coniformis]
MVPPLPTDLDLSKTFQLASLPGATKTIFLDFDGHVTSGTYWNSKYRPGKISIATPPYTIDDSYAFSDIELATIQAIWQRVAEDFAPFDVNVTTIEPSSADLVRSGVGDDRWGMRVNIGGSYMDWLRQKAGGIAIVGSFGGSADVGAFVFTEHRFGAEKYTADCISHEVGHTLGLSHKGAPGSVYYSGHGSGDTGWAPLMGASYNQPLSQWSRGEYAGATNRLDELKTITTGKGVNYRVDDYGSSRTSASMLPIDGIEGDVRRVQVSGLIEKNTDQDWFVFATTGGLLSLDFLPAARGANLDILASLYDASGNLVASSNPADRIDARLELELPAGVYSIMVDGVGARSVSDGYSDYGSLGQYTISGTIAGSGAVAGELPAGGWISGSIWNDVDRDGVTDSNDRGLEGILVFLDLDGDGLFNPEIETSTTTDAAGRYSFCGLAAGSYRVTAGLAGDWLPTGGGVDWNRTAVVPEFGLVENVDFAAFVPPLMVDDVTDVSVDVRSKQTRVAGGAMLHDPDTSSFAGSRISIQMSAGATSSDRLFVAAGMSSAGTLTIVKSTIRIDGRAVATFTGGSGTKTLVITFNAAATREIVEAVVQSIAYRTTSSRVPPVAKSVSMSLLESNGTRSNVLLKSLSLWKSV